METAHEKALFCQNCSSGLCASCQRIYAALVERTDQCSQLYNISPFKVAVRRMPALLLTLTLEIVGAIIINQLRLVLLKFILLSSFIGVIHALSGNLGLQTASNITRGLATGNVDKKKFKAQVMKEVLTGVFCSIFIALLLGSVAASWAKIDPKESKNNELIKNYPIIFGGVIILGTLLSMMISSTNGSIVPFLADKLNLDPAKFAGPLETAFQDIAGSAFLLGLSSWILLPFAPKEIVPTCPITAHNDTLNSTLMVDVNSLITHT